MSDYFHESMVDKMVSSNGYQQGYSDGFANGYNQDRKDAIDKINSLIRFIEDNSFDHKLECDSFKAIESSLVIGLLEKLKEEQNGRD